MFDGHELAWDLRGRIAAPQSVAAAAAKKNAGSQAICIVSQYSPDILYYANISRPNHQAYAALHGYFYKSFSARVSGGDFLDPGHPERIREEGLYWQSVAAIRWALESREPGREGLQCQMVVWVDADVLFTDLARPITEMLTGADAMRDGQLAYSAVFSREETMSGAQINSGVVIVNNTAGGRALIDAVYASYPAYKDAHWPEQMAMEDYALGLWPREDAAGVESFAAFQTPSQETAARASPLLRADVKLVPQRTMNSLWGTSPWWSPSLCQAWQWQPGDFIAHFAGGKSLHNDAERIAAMRDLANLSLASGGQGDGP